ncbi:MAG: rhodanese-like domain-containing protein [Pyrinomonadaceae bacterium]
MQFIFTIFIALTFALSMLQCQPKIAADGDVKAINTNPSATVTPAPTVEEAPRISLADAKADYDKGTAIFVDARAEAAYQNEHIKGSINLSAENFEAKYKELPTDKKIIAYCS